MGTDRGVLTNKETMLFIVDAQNLFYSAKELFGKGSRIDFKKLRNTVCAGRDFGVVYSIAYVPEIRDDSGTLSKALRRLGYEMLVRGEHFDQQIEQITPLAMQYDTVAVASGDGAFLNFYARCKDAGKRTEVFSFVDAVNSGIIAAVNAFTYLNASVLLGDVATLESIKGQ